MTTAVQHRRGTTTEHSVFTGLEGELTIDTTKDTAVIHDGALQGGYPLAKENLVNVNPTTLASIDGASTAADDQMVIYDTSVGVMKKISRAELNNAIVIDALDNVDINGGTIDGTVIGGANAAAGTFTTLTTSSTVTLNGGTANGVLYLNASKVATSGTALTFDGATLTNGGNIVALGGDFSGQGASGYVQLRAGSADANTYIIRGASAGAQHEFVINGTEQMRLTSTGLGIGTSSPGAKLDVNGDARVGNATAGTNRRLSINGVVNKASLIAFQESGTDRWLIGNGAASENGNFEIYDATTGNNFILTRSGNLGLGVTPSARILDVGGAISAARFTSTTGTNQAQIEVKNTSGSFYFGIDNSVGAAFSSGAYGRAIFSEGAYPLVFSTNSTVRLRIDSSGNLLVGTTSASVLAGAGRGLIEVNGSSDSAFAMKAGGTLYSYLYNSASEFRVANITANPVTFYTNNTERARIDSSGNLLVGTTTNINAARIKIEWTTGGYGIESIASADTLSYHMVFSNASNAAAGNISTTDNTTTYATSSDYRLKNVTGPITTSGAYIDSLKPVEGTWKSNGSPFVGLIAHEVQEVSRTQVATGIKDGEQMQGMDYSSAEIIANLIAEVQSLRVRIAALESK